MNYHKIVYDDQLNGEGLRVTLFVSGCGHRCKGCHNPQTWDDRSGKLFDEKAKKELFELASKDYISGITLSGGDPLYWNNMYGSFDILTDYKVKFPDKNTWLYTGYTYEQIIKSPTLMTLMLYVDVLVDGKFVKELADFNYKWAGSTNQRIIDMQESIKQNKLVLYKS